jgi:hypothetical protein
MKDKRISRGEEGGKIFEFRNYWRLYASVVIENLIFGSRTLASRITQYVKE